ncbi:MAG: hypothetical protein IH608_05205 [Proteobacteria bacterium]|nr:hypothetical protein [Pseudomonadota bacterium]
MRRSLGAEGSARTRHEEKEAFDQRVLGSGAFVERLWQDEERQGRRAPSCGLGDLIGRVARRFGVDEVRVLRRGKARELVEARQVICFLAVKGIGLATAEVGQALGLGQSGVSRAVAGGEAVVGRDPRLREMARDSIRP